MSIKTINQLRETIQRKPPPARYPSRPSQVFDYVLAHKIQNNGNSPTLREICAAIGINSTSNVSDYLDTLETQGLIKRGFDKARSIEIPGWSYREDETSESGSERAAKKQNSLTLEVSLADGKTKFWTVSGFVISDGILTYWGDDGKNKEVDIDQATLLSVVAGEEP